MAGRPKSRASRGGGTRYRLRNAYGHTPWFDSIAEANAWLDKRPNALGGPAMTVMYERDPPSESDVRRRREAEEARRRAQRAQEQADAEAYKRHAARLRARRGR